MTTLAQEKTHYTIKMPSNLSARIQWLTGLFFPGRQAVLE